MIDLIKKELIILGVIPIEGSKFRIDLQEKKYDEALNFFKNRSIKNRKLLFSLWNELKDILINSHDINYYNNNVDYNTSLLFVPALQSLHHLASHFVSLNNNEVVSVLYSCLCKDINSFSDRAMKRTIEYRLGIEWMDHLVMKDLYICSLLSSYNKINNESLNVFARGVPGPWSNLDLPIKERMYEWSEIDDELTSRTRDRQRQPRYYMGLEDYNSPRVKEGFVWEEIRRFPYEFGDEDNNIYPHRNLLWKS